MVNIVKSFIDSIKGSTKELVDVGKEYVEIALDQVTDSETLKVFPIVNSVVAFYKVGLGIKERFTIQKIVRFLTQLNEIPQEEKERFLTKISNDESSKNQIFEKLLIILDRLDDQEKALILGNLFKATIQDIIDLETFFRLSSIVDRAFIDDIVPFIKTESKPVFKEDGTYELTEWQVKFRKVPKKNLTALGLLEEKIVENKSATEQRKRYGFDERVIETKYQSTNLGRLLSKYAY